ncbi:MAG: DUF1223 domain-containing protein [Hyphomicrobiales bacterium]|nr:DUF1223 domain-containing protein [Hyphomicrobiales bacterium]
MIRYCLAVFAAGSLVLATPVCAQPRAVIELFTSQGCSSCPAADRLLGELARDPSLIAISLSIDVWDYLGWKDTLADRRNTARWQDYAKARGDRERYTPQAVVNGFAHALGSDRAAIEAAIAASRLNRAVMSVPVTVSREGGSLAVELPETPPGTATTVSAWALAKAITVTITRGENKGRTVTYHNVARHFVGLGEWTAQSRRWSVPLRDLAGDGAETVAVLVQKGTAAMPGLVLGAAMLPLR